MIRKTLTGDWTLYEVNCPQTVYPVTVPGSVLSAFLDAVPDTIFGGTSTVQNFFLTDASVDAEDREALPIAYAELAAKYSFPESGAPTGFYCRNEISCGATLRAPQT